MTEKSFNNNRQTKGQQEQQQRPCLHRNGIILGRVTRSCMKKILSQKKQTETVSHVMKEKVSTRKTNEGAIATSTSLVVFMGLKLFSVGSRKAARRKSCHRKNKRKPLVSWQQIVSTSDTKDKNRGTVRCVSRWSSQNSCYQRMQQNISYRKLMTMKF